MADITLNTNDVGGFFVGLLCNVIEMRWWHMKPFLIANGTDIDHPVAQKVIAEQMVDLVLSRFGTSRAAKDLQKSRDQLVEFLLEGMRKSPDGPELPKLTLVP